MLAQSHLYFFINKRVKYVSICPKGYEGCHLLVAGDLELVDHNPKKCLECNANKKQGSLMGMAKAFAATSVEKVRLRMKARPSNLSLPDRATTLKQTAELMLLQTILRDKTIGNKKFRKAAN